MKIDARSIVHLFGGPSTLYRRLKLAGEDVSLKAIDMWVYRSSIPGKRLMMLANLAKKDGVRFDLTKYMLEDEPVPDEEKLETDEDNDLDFLN